jgi:hypothetical protein
MNGDDEEETQLRRATDTTTPPTKWVECKVYRNGILEIELAEEEIRFVSVEIDGKFETVDADELMGDEPRGKRSRQLRRRSLNLDLRDGATRTRSRRMRPRNLDLD